MDDTMINWANVNEILEGFRYYLIGVRDASGETVAAYHHDVTTYIMWLHKSAAPGFCINPKTMRGFATYLRECNCGSATVARRIHGVRAMWRYLHLEHDYAEPRTAEDCGIRIKGRRGHPTIPISRDNFQKLLEAIYEQMQYIQ